MASQKWLVKGAEVRVDLVLITPEMAADWLNRFGGRNFRRVTPDKLRQYTDTMKRGGWRFNGATIVFRSDGTMADGQKRLAACVASGVPLLTFVFWGIDEDMTYDIGERRTLTQFFQQRGEKYACALATAIRWLWRIEADAELWNNASSRIPYAALVQFLDEQHPALCDSLPATVAVDDVVPHSMAAVVHYQAARAGLRQEADRFFHMLRTGADIAPGDPILALRNRLLERRTSIESIDTVSRMALLILAWNSWLQGRTVKNIFWRRVGPKAMAFPKQIVTRLAGDAGDANEVA